ncbi:unnamed protein product [Penicillium bialowiezense]
MHKLKDKLRKRFGKQHSDDDNKGAPPQQTEQSVDHSLIHRVSAPISNPDPVAKPDLWQRAFDALDPQKQKLIKSISIAKSDRVIDRLNTLNDVVETVKTQYEIDQAKSRIRAPAQKIITSVLGFQDLIQAAVGFDPTGHATSVWAIVSLGLNTTQNYRTQKVAWLESSSFLADVLTRYSLIEAQYQKGTEIDQSMETALVGVYIAVLTFAAQVQSLYDRNRAVFLWKSISGESLSDLRESITEAESDLSQWLDIVDRREQQERGKQLLEMADTMLAGIDRVMDSLDQIHGEMAFAKLQTADADYKADWGEEYSECLEDTRVELLRDIKEWATDMDRNAVFWLQGMAGTGKSTVSRTVARWLDDEGLLAGSFFFKKGGTDREDAARLFTTLTKQMLRVLPCLQEPVKNAIKEARDIGSNPKEQFDKLLFKPLRSLSLGLKSPLILIIVIDALDECQVPAHVESFFSSLPQLAELKDIRLRFFITSRPEPPVTKGFRRTINDEIVLHQIVKSTIEHDISIFLEKRLDTIRCDHELGKSWAGQDTLKALVNMAVPLFIYAATICRFVNCEGESPKKRLQAILSSRLGEGIDTIDGEYSKLTDLYLPILQHVVCEKHQKERSKWMNDFSRFVGAIVLLFSPLSSVSLAKLIRSDEDEVQARFSTLQSVLSVPRDPNVPVQLLHLSFRDFLVDRSASSKFWIDESAGHAQLAEDCLGCMEQNLSRNICGFDPGVRKDEIEKSVLESNVPSELRYACRYWVRHLERGEQSNIDWRRIEQFLKVNFLHWLEVMSLFGWASETIEIVAGLRSLEKSSQSATLAAFLQDGYRFVLKNRQLVDETPLQVYYAGIIFAPQMSQIRKEFRGYFPDWISQLPKVEERWSAELQILEGHSDTVETVVFSPDGAWLASASSDGTVRFWDTANGSPRQTIEHHFRDLNSMAVSSDGAQVATVYEKEFFHIWDTATGVLQRTLNGHSDWVRSVAFSPDGAWLASCSDDKTICFWDRESGELKRTLEGHLGIVLSIGFSPNSKLLASASTDRTTRIWDAVTGALQHTLEGHIGEVTSVAFSPDGTWLASGSFDKTIRFWDTKTGVLKRTLKGHSEEISSIAFSPNKAQLASASADGTICLWDTTTGALTQALKGSQADWARSIAFSPSGTQLASAPGNSICLWDIATGVLSEEPESQTTAGHSEMVCSMAFLPDAMLLASGANDRTICLWDTATGVLKQTLKGHPAGWIYSIVISPDGTQLASSSNAGPCLWDIAASVRHDNLEGQTLEGHSDIVRALDFSPDGKLLAAGSDDQTIRLWDTVTCTLQQILKGHSSWVESVAFSPDGGRLASGSMYALLLWDTATGELKHSIGVSGLVTDIQFNHDGSHLITNCGSFDVESGSEIQVTPDHGNQGISLEGEWIALNGKNVLWLPPGYRPGEPRSVAINGDLLALGLPSGSVSFIRFNI